jgi:hypothetical protein
LAGTGTKYAIIKLLHNYSAELTVIALQNIFTVATLTGNPVPKETTCIYNFDGIMDATIDLSDVEKALDLSNIRFQLM